MLVGADAIVRNGQAKFGCVFTPDRHNVAALEANQVLLEPAPLLDLDALLDRRHGSPPRLTQPGDKLSCRNERITRTHAVYRLRSKHGRSQRTELVVGHFGA